MLMRCLKVCGWKLGSISSKPVVSRFSIGNRHRNVLAESMVRNVVVAVDPDTRGAIVTATWEGSEGSSTTVDIASVSLKVYDMPCASIQLVKKIKTTGRQAVRRSVDIRAAQALILQSAPQGEGPRRLLAFIESPPIMPTYTHGVWQGLLSMGGYTTGSVPARAWKRDFGLWRRDKDASRLLAMKIFPALHDLLQLKKHHGRAEALLIAAWGLGVCVDKDTQSITFGPMRCCKASDAYGNPVVSSFIMSQGPVMVTESQVLPDMAIYADARSLLDQKRESENARIAEKLEKAEKRKRSRRVIKSALAACQQEGE